MIKEAEFEVKVTDADCRRFAEVSGDWNPLHTDLSYARVSVYGRQILHGAYSAGLISRLAGMYLPGKECLLHGMKLRFVAPILPPATLKIRGQIVSSTGEIGRVNATVSDADSGLVYADASYEFGLHRMALPHSITHTPPPEVDDEVPVILITGSSGGLGGALLERLGGQGRAVIRSEMTGRIDIEATLEMHKTVGQCRVGAIVHCAWPMPDNRGLLDLDDPATAVDQQIAGPLKDVQALASFLAERGVPNAPLILIGSTYARPGRHYFRMPLYSLAKAMIPTLVDVLSLELASREKRCVGVIFDVLDGGMNKGIGAATRQANADRSPWGELATIDEAADQIIWLLSNQSRLISGSIVTLTAGSIP